MNDDTQREHPTRRSKAEPVEVGLMFHDPRREVEKLRDHLASHDKPISFLIGAGASAVNDAEGNPLVPTILPLGRLCAAAVGEIGEPHAEIYAAIRAQVEAANSENRPANVEEILSSVRQKTDALADGERIVGLADTTKQQLEAIERTMRMTIATAALPEDDRIPAQLPHHALARWISRIPRTTAVELFTTNYDTLLERGLEDEQSPVFDGFVGSRRPFFSAGSLIHEDLAPGQGWVRLWKVHGSVNWSWEPSRDGTRQIVRREESTEGELILPSFHKYDESRKQPYVAMLDRLGRVLTHREDTLLLTVGYSFGDDHINEILFDALDSHPRLHVVALQFSDPDMNHQLVRRALRLNNLLVYGPTRAIVGGEVGEWRLLDPVDDRTAGLLDIPFDSDGQPDPAESAVAGRFRLGDFRWFGRFLDDISGHHD